MYSPQGRKDLDTTEQLSLIHMPYNSSCCCCSVAKSCPTLCEPIDCRTSGSSVLHYLPEFAQNYVHWVSDAIQPSHPLSPWSPSAHNLSQHWGLFQWVGSSHQMAKVHAEDISPSHKYSGLISFRIVWFALLAVQGTQKYSLAPQFKSINSSVLSLLHGLTLTSIHDLEYVWFSGV